MSKTKLRLLSEEICRESGVELDQDGCDELREIFSRVGNKWPDNAYKILEEHNQPLLAKFFSLGSQIDSLLLLPNKPATLKKELKAKLEEYEHTIGICAGFAERHLNS